MLDLIPGTSFNLIPCSANVAYDIAALCHCTAVHVHICCTSQTAAWSNSSGHEATCTEHAVKILSCRLWALDTHPQGSCLLEQATTLLLDCKSLAQIFGSQAAELKKNAGRSSIGDKLMCTGLAVTSTSRRCHLTWVGTRTSNR